MRLLPFDKALSVAACLSLKGFIVADKCAVHGERRQPLHSTVETGRLERLGKHIKPGKCTDIKVALAAAGGHRPHQRFTAQGDAVMSVSPAVR